MGLADWAGQKGSRVERTFFELMQVAVGRRDSLTHNPSEEEWRELYSMAEKQTVLGVCFYAVQRLHAQGQIPPQTLIYEWFSVAESIKQTNETVTKRSRKVQGKFAEAGIRSSILKGQAVAKYYGEELSKYRQPGDIDVYVDCGLERALQFAHDWGLKDARWDYKHLHLDVFNDTEVEVHYRVEVLLNLWRNRKLQKWLKEHESLLFRQREGLVMPTTAFNRFYILLHVFRHFLYEGVGMRQLMDYFFVLTDVEEDKGTIDIEALLKQFGMWRFARGIMWVMQEVFRLERREMLCEPLESEGRFILKEIMTGGNFGHHDERIAKRRKGKMFTVMAICKHNMHLMRHYPSEVAWPPIWFFWHKCWKWKTEKHLNNELHEL